MFVVKVLERKIVIRLFGLGLLISPLFNTIAKILITTNVPNKWSFVFAQQVIQANTTPNKILFICSMLIGALMLRGDKSAWKYTLALLGCHIVNQIINFGPNVRASWLFAVFFVVNVAIFLFIADQLVWKVGPTKPRHKRLRPMANKSEKKIMVHFEGFGPWAKLTSVSTRGLHIRGIDELPFELSHRAIEVKISDGLVLKTRLSRNMDKDYFFEYIDITPAESEKLNQWLRSQVKAA